MNLKINFSGFLTMLIKLMNNTMVEEDMFKTMLIMNSDSTATLKFMKFLEFK